ncbi:MAG: hypothetical protein IJN71_05970 [Oscillospiraceae bacterium]|nr:hypothetical protein [Oscillospiraceae bacterium]
MKKLQEKLDFLLEKYAVNVKVEICDGKSAKFDGKVREIYPWRSERRFFEMKKAVDIGELNNISTFRITHITKQGTDLYALLRREADVFEFILGSKIVEIFAVENTGYALNATVLSENGYVGSFELASTLSENEIPVEKHEIIAKSGNMCDMVVDTQVPQSSIYVMKADGETSRYTDVDAELFGLSIDECAIVRTCWNMARGESSMFADGEHLDAVISAAKKSISDVENIAVAK